MTPDQVLAALAGNLPPAVLVLGEGAWPLIGQAAGPDWLLKWDLSASDARRVRESVFLLPLDGLRVIALCLDKASDQVLNMLLSVLEAPPTGTRFVLAATERPLDTVVSRCWLLPLSAAATGPVPPPAAEVNVVAAAVKAARSGQPQALTAVLRGWQPAHARHLAAWAAEVAAGRHRLFAPGLVPGVTRSQAVSLLAELSRHRTGTRLAAHAALERVFSRA